MYSGEQNRLTEEFQEIVRATTKLSFPFLSDKKEKEAIIAKEKERVDSLVDKLAEKYNVSIDAVKCCRNRLWDDAQNAVMEKFSTLPAKLRTNSFSLQELLHEYAENQVKQILRMISAEDYGSKEV